MEVSMKKVNPLKALPDRNEGCPCGSGKKYKRCCLEKDQTSASEILDTITQLPNLAARSTIVRERVPLYPWLRKNFTGVGKYAPKQTPNSVE